MYVGHSCEKAFDGNEDTFWNTKDDVNVGSWIKLNLVGVYRLTKIMVMQRHDGSIYHPKDISLEFSSGEEVYFTLNNSMEYQTIELDGIGSEIITNYVNISVITSYTKEEIGFAELKVFGPASVM